MAPVLTLNSDTAFMDAVTRVKATFLEMPGLKVTVEQAARLLAFDTTLCRDVLLLLVETRFLIRTRDDAFARA